MEQVVVLFLATQRRVRHRAHRMRSAVAAHREEHLSGPQKWVMGRGGGRDERACCNGGGGYGGVTSPRMSPPAAPLALNGCQHV